MKPWLKLFLAVAIPLAVGGLSSIVTTHGVNGWYRTIAKPAWNPPDTVFAPVWTTLYILMGIALFQVWKKEAAVHLKQRAIFFWVLQLVLNALWSFIFFGMHNIGLALLEIMLLWFAILMTILLFANISKLAAWLLVPYMSWVSFATILNFAIWRLNT